MIEGFVHRLTQRQKFFQPHQLDGLGHPRIADGLQSSRLTLNLLGQLHQGTHPRAVDKINARQIQNHMRRTFLNVLAHHLTENGLRKGIQKPRQVKNPTVVDQLLTTA